jgi:2-succinyl-6-hydroxy-2,4-cyclohexadiene-1-carboxylate synthase
VLILIPEFEIWIQFILDMGVYNRHLLFSIFKFYMYNWHFITTGDPTFPPLLLLHGWMGCCEDYTEIIEVLKSRYYCIAIDLPGHGKTAVIGGDIGYDFINTAKGIIQLLDSLSINRCSIAGYSFGGRLALYLALEFPARFDRSILESTSPGLKTEIDRQTRVVQDWQIIDRLETDNFANFVSDWYRQSIFIGIEKYPGFENLIKTRVASNQVSNLIKSIEYAGLGMQPYLGDRLKSHTQPISLIVGALDRKFVAIGETINQSCQFSKLITVPNCSHNVHFQQPQIWIEHVLNR